MNSPKVNKNVSQLNKNKPCMSSFCLFLGVDDYLSSFGFDSFTTSFLPSTSESFKA